MTCSVYKHIRQTSQFRSCNKLIFWICLNWLIECLCSCRLNPWLAKGLIVIDYVCNGVNYAQAPPVTWHPHKLTQSIWNQRSWYSECCCDIWGYSSDEPWLMSWSTPPLFFFYLSVLWLHRNIKSTASVDYLCTAADEQRRSLWAQMKY